LQELKVPVLSATGTERIAPKQRVHMTHWQQALKRLMDVAGGIVLLILSAPLIGLLALRITLHDGGRALFRRRVVGPKGEFDAFKLRTMRVDADDVLSRDDRLRRQFEVNFKLQYDPRVTAVGVALRRSGLDELPQLWNVIKGQMSLVGPRMITPAELQRYGDAGWIFNLMKPGVTGYWQVQGDPAAGYDRRIAMDLFYAENWSLMFDLKILITTPARVLRGSGV
jgi:lipopolysaccharide/colanic/teichoic acid biosynthesis glycosyltransferase